jgi:DNA-binding NtrC family response regulator
MIKVQPSEYRVLVVDDDPTMLLMLSSVLENGGYVTREATDGIDATHILTQEPVDVIVADFNMPGLDGLGLLRHAKLARPSAVRIMFTGQADLDTAVRAINESGVFRFLLKPVEPEDLLRHVMAACERVALEREVVRLRKAMQDRDTQLARLEKSSPGITQVERRSDGALVIDDSYFDDPPEEVESS